MTGRPDDVERTHRLARGFTLQQSRADRVGTAISQALIVLYVGFAIAVVMLWLVALAVLAWRVIYP